MNRADVEMLNRSLDDLGNTFLRQRALKQEQEHGDEMLQAEQLRASTDADFRKAQLQHEQNMETKLDEGNQARTSQAAVQQKQQMLQTILHLNATGQLDDAGIQSVNEFLKNDDVFKTTGIQISKPSAANAKNKDAAVVNALKQAQTYREQAGEAADENEAAQANQYADLLEGWVKRSGSFKPVTGYTETKTQPVMDLAGKQTGTKTNLTTRTPFVLPNQTPVATPAPSGTGTIVPAAHINFLKSNPTAKVISDFEQKYGAGSAQQYLKQ